MKKHAIVLILMMSFGFSASSFAEVTMLWKATNTTYVSSEHADEYLADKYYGTASIRGADRIRVNNTVYYFNWTRITYDVQGTFYSATAYSNGKYNTAQVIRTVTAQDKWNFGPKTDAYYNFSRSVDSDFVNNSNSSLNHQEIISGGELKEGQVIIENFEILNQGKDSLDSRLDE